MISTLTTTSRLLSYVSRNNIIRPQSTLQIKQNTQSKLNFTKEVEILSPEFHQLGLSAPLLLGKSLNFTHLYTTNSDMLSGLAAKGHSKFRTLMHLTISLNKLYTIYCLNYSTICIHTHTFTYTHTHTHIHTHTHRI